MTTGRYLLEGLAHHGIVVTVVAGRLHVEAPPGTPMAELRAVLSERKSELLALLTGNPVGSHVDGIVWDPRGGVRVADDHQPDLRKLCQAQTREQGYPRLQLSVHPIAVPGGESAWETFAVAAPLNRIADALCTLDDFAPEVSPSPKASDDPSNSTTLATGPPVRVHVASRADDSPTAPSRNQHALGATGAVVSNFITPIAGNPHANRTSTDRSDPPV